MKNYKLIVLDWDGTLVNSTSQLINQVKEVASIFSLSMPDNVTIKKCIGIKLEHAFDLLFPSAKNKNGLLNCFCDLSKESRPALYDGAKEFIKHLKEKNYYIAIATNRDFNSLKNEIDYHDINHYFDYISCANEKVYKPDPNLLLPIFKNFKLLPSEALMIGDSESDALLAKNSDTDAIIVSNGLREKSDFYHYNLIGYFENILEIKKWMALTKVQ